MFDRIKLIFSGIWTFLEPFIRVFLSQAGPVLAKAALSAVQATAASMTGATGTEKRDAAYDLIVRDLTVQGVAIGAEVTTSMINAAIEAAVQRLKAGA